MARLSNGPNFADCLTVGEAASYLGVSTATLRNWDRTGKLKPRRHPQNGYRIYLHGDLQAVLRSADLSMLNASKRVPRIDWTEMGDSDHFVQFYESDEYLIDSVSAFVASALVGGDSSVVIATLEQRVALQRELSEAGISVAAAIESGRYVVLDAAETLAKVMVNGFPDASLFHKFLGETIARLAQEGRRVHAFGGMVSLLWEEGKRRAAIRLEELWNELGNTHRFALFCAYPISLFSDESHSVPFHGICACHSRVIPAESYADVDGAEERRRVVSILQQKAQSLETEIAYRTEVQNVLSERERELADFFENATVGIHKVGPDGTILWANRADYEFLGYEANEYIGHSITEFHADAHVIADMLTRLQRGETLKDCPARLLAKDASIKHVLVNSNACFDNEVFAYTRCFTRDVTQQYQAEQALREADLRKDQFLATLAHELRNPLAPIQHGLEMLQVDSGDSRLASEARDVIDRQVQQLTCLVDDLLDISRIARGKIELRKERVELAALIDRAIETCQPHIELRRHELTVSVPPRPIYLDADPTRISQIFSNLLSNSAKYTPPSGRIEIEAKLEGQHAVIIVRDNGVGIPSDSLPYVFDMFRQVDSSLDRAQGGLGIGLTLVRQFVELHGGTINATSDGPGTGSEFTVCLPVASNAVIPTPRLRPVDASAAIQQRVLVVDDNKDSGDTLSMLLRVKGHDVRVARDGFEAIQIAAEFLPKVILMDIGMPRLSGHDTTRRIRETPSGKDMMIVALSGWGQPEDVRLSLEAGCNDHLVKPVDLAKLERILSESLSV